MNFKTTVKARQASYYSPCLPNCLPVCLLNLPALVCSAAYCLLLAYDDPPRWVEISLSLAAKAKISEATTFSANYSLQYSPNFHRVSRHLFTGGSIYPQAQNSFQFSTNTTFLPHSNSGTV